MSLPMIFAGQIIAASWVIVQMVEYYLVHFEHCYKQADDYCFAATKTIRILSLHSITDRENIQAIQKLLQSNTRFQIINIHSDWHCHSAPSALQLAREGSNTAYARPEPCMDMPTQTSIGTPKSETWLKIVGNPKSLWGNLTRQRHISG